MGCVPPRKTPFSESIRTILIESQNARGILRATVESVLKRQAEFTNCRVEAMGDGMGVCHDPPTPPYVRFTVWNPAMQEQTGYSLSAVNEKGWQCALPVEEARQQEARQRARRMRRGDHLRGDEWTIPCSSGERWTLQVHSTIVQPPGGRLHVLLVLRNATARKAAEQLVQHQRDLAQFSLDTVQSLMLALDCEGRITMINRAGRIVGTLSSGADITERRAAERELERYRTHLEALVGQRTLELSAAKEAAETANRGKSDFLSRMSHELRTPMNAIIGFTQMLEYDGDLNADQHDSVHEILKASRHLLHLINDVLDLARIESGRIELSLEATDVAAVVDDCRHLVEPLAAPCGITLLIDVPAGTWVTADRVRLKQALLNLLSNAVKCNRAQGRIHLVVQMRQSEREARTRIGVADTGIGIADERLIELMGGEIGAESEAGAGSRFWIELPNASVTRPDDHSNVSPGAGTQSCQRATSGASCASTTTRRTSS